MHAGHARDFLDLLAMISLHSLSPSAATWSAGTPRRRRTTSSGTYMPGTSPRMNSSARSDLTGPTPARMEQLLVEAEVADLLHPLRERCSTS